MANSVGYSIISLGYLISLYGREEVIDMISGFEPLHDSTPGEFLRNQAIDMELRDISRTHLAISTNFRILGYYTLSIKCMKIPDENHLSNSALRKMNIESASGVAQSYLLGQLCRSADSWPGFGKTLIASIFENISTCKSIVGCRMVRLDCENNMVNYYKGQGFRVITKNNENDLNQMMAFV